MPRTLTAVSIAAAALLLAGSASATEELGTYPGTDTELQAELVAAELQPAAEMKTQGSEQTEPEATEEPLANGHVARAGFTTGVVDREPKDEVTRLENDSIQILFFTELRGLQGQTVTHLWERDGEIMAEVPFSVGAPRWRVHSSKKLDPEWTGAWSVKVIDAEGQVIHVESFDYVAAATPEPEASPASMPLD